MLVPWLVLGGERAARGTEGGGRVSTRARGGTGWGGTWRRSAQGAKQRVFPSFSASPALQPAGFRSWTAWSDRSARRPRSKRQREYQQAARARGGAAGGGGGVGAVQVGVSTSTAGSMALWDSIH